METTIPVTLKCDWLRTNINLPTTLLFILLKVDPHEKSEFKINQIKDIDFFPFTFIYYIF